MQLQVVKQQMPVIEFNYEEIKANLNLMLDEYRNIQVTADTLKDDKATQQKLAGLRNKIDSFRIDLKKELSKPISETELKLKELVELVKEVEKPIKEGIEVFNLAEREEKRQKCLEIKNELIDKYQLSSKYADKVEIRKPFMNKTTTFKFIREVLEDQVSRLKDQEINESQIMDAIDEHIKRVNEAYNLITPLSAVQFEFEYTVDGLKKAMKDIDERAKQQYDAEQAAKMAVDEPVWTPGGGEVEVEMRTYAMEFTGPKEVMFQLAKWMKVNGITYKKIKEGYDYE